eukprot:6926500-Pyramimonas_sp.AAC.1
MTRWCHIGLDGAQQVRARRSQPLAPSRSPNLSLLAGFWPFQKARWAGRGARCCPGNCASSWRREKDVINVSNGENI